MMQHSPLRITHQYRSPLSWEGEFEKTHLHMLRLLLSVSGNFSMRWVMRPYKQHGNHHAAHC
jgi:hypothetical protein